ncbi:hypothetical protein TNIN_34151 [Trichonephila inaurata madagascariensis]|uniref:Uncharacterized protein n=1 Tax=Trichonephila inaurata madagascariensis TaxID=2747483 RepID=A0A8X6XEY3_9ARAC|nr:hypothetical protein TNIN_34151 [Trichonephila inaurata madagascariensis]
MDVLEHFMILSSEGPCEADFLPTRFYIVSSHPVGSISSGKACLQLPKSFSFDIRVRRRSTLGYQLTRPTKLIVSHI